MIKSITLDVTMVNGQRFEKVMAPNHNDYSHKDKNNAYKWQAMLMKDSDIEKVDVIIE